MLWLFKILAVPLLVAGATLVIRRWGAAVGGLLIGLPLMTGPISVFLAIDQGTAFAERATIGILVAVAAMGPYALASYWTADRLPWYGCIGAALSAFGLTSWVLQSLIDDLRVAAATSIVTILGALLVMPRVRLPAGAPRAPWWDLWFRMLVTAVVVVSVTVLAGGLGPHLSGIVSTLPIISTVIISFTLQQSGPVMARGIIRANATSMLSFTAFFVVVGEAIRPWGILPTYALALVVTVGMSTVVAMLDRNLASTFESRPDPITKALE